MGQLVLVSSCDHVISLIAICGDINCDDFCYMLIILLTIFVLRADSRSQVKVRACVCNLLWQMLYLIRDTLCLFSSQPV